MFETEQEPVDIKRFTSSLNLETKFMVEDLLASIAYVKMLMEEKLIDSADGDAVITALQEAKSQVEAGEFIFEDPTSIYPNIERHVLESCGLSGGKMFLGRSKNDDVMTDARLASRRELLILQEHLLKFQQTLAKTAWKQSAAVMPSFRHTHAEQLVTLGHYLLYQLDTLSRDSGRLQDLYKRVNLSPLGSGFGGGSSFEIDRLDIRESLAFEGLVENTLDAVNSADYLLEMYSDLAILMAHLGRLAEDLILFSNEELRLIELSEEHSLNGTSLKQSPAVLEMVRAKTGKVYGSMTQAFSILKGLPTGHIRDVQEVYSLMFETIEVVVTSIRILEAVVKEMTPDEKRMVEIANKRFACAPDLAELFVKKGISLKNANAVVGTVIKQCKKDNKLLDELEPEFLEVIILRQLKYEVKIKNSELKDAVDPKRAIQRRKTKGGPNPKEVKRMVANREQSIERLKKQIQKEKVTIKKAYDRLE